MPFRRKFGTPLLHLVKRLALRHEQTHTLCPGPDRPAVIGVFDDKSGCCCSLSHARA